MARRNVLNESGLPLLAPAIRKEVIFQLAQTIELELAVEAVPVRKRDPESGKPAIGMYLTSAEREILNSDLDAALVLWREHVG